MTNMKPIGTLVDGIGACSAQLCEVGGQNGGGDDGGRRHGGGSVRGESRQDSLATQETQWRLDGVGNRSVTVRPRCVVLKVALDAASRRPH